MDRFLIEGPCTLKGSVRVSGAKNAVLPLMAATLLTRGVSRIRDVPDLRDTRTMGRVLETLGAKVERDGSTLTVDTSDAQGIEAPYDLVKTMRASIYVLGPLLASRGEARVSLPGGCAWGPRPVNLHLSGMEALGATIELEGGYIVAHHGGRLRGAAIDFEISSVGATANVLMAAVLAKGTTVLENAAREPEVTQLAEALVRAGARIDGVGTTTLTVEGVERLQPLDVAVVPDRIEAGTFLAAAAALRSSITVENVIPAHLQSTLECLRITGCRFEVLGDPEHGFRIVADGRDAHKPFNAVTRPFPGFPTDMQAQTMAVACGMDGISVLTDTIYPDRFTHVAELRRLGAEIRLDGNSAVVRGTEKLTGAPVMATDLRASAALIIAGLAAHGTTLLDRVYHIDRGYEKIERKLEGLGARIEARARAAHTVSRRTLILGTAGHVDHGKTALIRALTGIDTDRLDEEHRRGISIELGFAHLDLSDDLRLGIVDVPGHERFVRQMVAGAGGMDLAMLLVAADEGIMPQTSEHLDVLQLLGVSAGLLVLTKSDLADPDLVEVIEEELRDRVAGTFLARAPVVRVSAHTGEGLDQLREALTTLAREAPPKGRDGDFREPIDRVFALPGAGVVITGTAWSGTVRVGDSLRLLPRDVPVRVREVQSHGEKTDAAGAGERVALALHGVKKDDVHRGDLLVSGPAWSPARILGVRMEAVRQGGHTVKQRARLHVHHAAREVLARVDLLEADALTPGASSLARLHLEEPLTARPGDRMVLRSYSPMLTVAGAVVLDPAAIARQRRRDSLAWLQALDARGPEAWPWIRVEQAGLSGLSRRVVQETFAMLGVTREESTERTERALREGHVCELGDALVAGDVLRQGAEVALQRLRRHQSEHPMSPGLSKEELRQAASFTGSAQLFSQLLTVWSHEHPFFLREDRVRADSAAPQLSGEQRAAVEDLERRIEEAHPVYQATAAEMNSPQLALLVGGGRVVKLGGSLLASRRFVDDIAQRAAHHFVANDVLEIRYVKEWTGASRKFVVPLLEWLDAHEITRFEHGVRRQGPACPDPGPDAASNLSA